MAAAATEDVAAAAVSSPADFLDDDIDFNIVDGLDFNIDDDGLDVVRDLDFDLGDLAAADEFRDAYAAFIANADPKIVGGAGGRGWIAGLCGAGGGSTAEGSTAGSCVTTDGVALAEEDEAVSEFVAELERFLMEDGNGEVETEAFCPDDFFGDLLHTSGSLDGVATGTLLHSEGEVEDNAAADGGGVLAAREDQQPSRKRARHKIKGTTVTPWRCSLEVTTRHLARIQVLAPWQPAAVPVLLCCCV